MAITQDFTTRDKFKFDNTRGGLKTLLRQARTEMMKSGCRGVMFAYRDGWPLLAKCGLLSGRARQIVLTACGTSRYATLIGR